MSEQNTLLERITARPDVFGGKPIVRDMRISVELVLSLLSQGVTVEEILEDYPLFGTRRYSSLHSLCARRYRRRQPLRG